VLMDEFSNGKAINGSAEIVVFNHADICALRPQHIVVGSV
jgi:hypothetical protein